VEGGEKKRAEEKRIGNLSKGPPPEKGARKGVHLIGLSLKGREWGGGT